MSAKREHIGLGYVSSWDLSFYGNRHFVKWLKVEICWSRQLVVWSHRLAELPPPPSSEGTWEGEPLNV